MNNINRKQFLRLSAAAVTSLVAGGVSGAPASGGTITATSKARLLIKNTAVLTMDPKLGELAETDVLVEDGKIAAIGKNLSVADAERVDGSGKILMPGMVDGHRHLWEYIGLGNLVKSNPTVYSRNYLLWKMSSVVSMTPEDHYLAEYIGGLHAIDSGVTSIKDFAHGQDTPDKAIAAAQGVKDSGIAGWFAFQLGMSYPFAPGDSVVLAEYEKQKPTEPSASQWATIDRLQSEIFSDSSALLQLGIAPLARERHEMKTLKKEWGRVRSTGVKLLAAHMHRWPAVPPQGYMGHRGSGIPDLSEAGLLGPDYHVSHANRLTADELALMRDSGGMICATTMGEFPYMMQSYRGPSVHGRARAAGVATGIGIDVPIALNGDYFEHVRASLWNHYLSDEGREIVEDYQSSDTLDFATALGAKAIRLGDTTGSISIGKRADLVMLDTDRIGFGMGGGLADRVVTFATTSDINSVWIAGKPRKRNGKMLNVDWSSLKSQLSDAHERVAKVASTVRFS